MTITCSLLGYATMVFLVERYFWWCKGFLARNKRDIFYELHRFENPNHLKRFFLMPWDFVRITYKTFKYYRMDDESYHWVMVERFTPHIFQMIKDHERKEGVSVINKKKKL